MRIPDYNALRTAVENEESILWLIGEVTCLPDYGALRAAVENEESILDILNAAVQNSGTQVYEELRYNHNHDSKGRFCSGSGEGGGSGKTLDKSAESGIIEKEKTMFSEEEVKPMTFSSDYNVPEGLTESASFRSKFCAMDDDPSVQNEYYQAAKEILQHRSGNDGEDLYYYNTATKKWYKSTTGTLKGTPDIYNEEIIKGLSESERGEIVAFHNHPRGMPPSDGDLNAALTKGYAKGYTIGHNGRIYEYTAPAEIIPEGMYDMFYAAFLADGHSDFDAQIMTIEKLKPVYRFSYKEIL